MKRKIAVLIRPGKFEIEEDNLEIEDNQVLVKISACGLCMYETYHFKGKLGSFPQKLGHEPSGIIEALGKNVKGFKEGDRVTGFFGPAFATYAIAQPESLIRIPDNIKLEHALGEPLTCAITSIKAAAPKIGDYVFLVGCGAMGLLTLAGIASKKCAEIIGVDLIDFRLKSARDLGATITLNPNEIDVEKEVIKITQDRGIDLAIEATGVSSAFDLASKVLRSGRAKLIVVGYHGSSATYNLSYLARGTIVHTTHPGYSLDIMDDLRRAMIALKKGVFPMDMIISHQFKLEDIQKGFEAMITKPEGYIKGIVVP